MTQKAIGYIRVSTDKQDQSLEVQSEKIKAYCNLQGFELAQIIPDEDVSGKTLLFDRKAGQILRTVACPHIIIASISRAFRNTTDGLLSMDHFTSQGKSMHVIDLGQIVNTATPVGRFMFTMLVSQAELERGLTAERIRHTAQSKKARGVRHCNKAPYGFRWEETDEVNQKTGKPVCKMVKDETEQQVISDIRKSADLTIAEIASRYQARGGGKMSTSLVHRIRRGVII